LGHCPEARLDNGVSVAIALPPVQAQASPPKGGPNVSEEVFYNQQGVLVTRSLVQLAADKTFATANITSVSTGTIQLPRPSPGCQIALIVAGAFGALIGFGIMLGRHVGAGFLTLLLIGAAPIAAGAFWLRSIKTPAPIYVLKIASAAGEVEGMRHYDMQLVQGVAAAIMRAIASRS